MEDRRIINDSYYCCRFRTEGPISVLTTTQYVVAEYDEKTGNMRWQRVVNASQKESIHNWLRDHFPVKVAPPKPIATRPAPKVKTVAAGAGAQVKSTPANSKATAGKKKKAA